MIILTLFWASFLASTILPFSSEAALTAALLSESNQILCLIAATLGNSLGSLTTFALGRFCKFSFLEKYCKVSKEKIIATQERIKKYTYFASFFCFLPIIGDVIAIALGYSKCSWTKFIVLMTLGKLLRYLLWIYLHNQVVS
jgi:membrane protein YqaA with SNARE-associated domain